MKTTAGNILGLMPRRRPRHWRYVSPHRRGAGVVILAMLIVGVFAYWLLPGLINKWTRDEAVAYLRSFTGGQVAIDGAGFTLFSGIELRGVSIDVPKPAGRERFFHAGNVVLRHRPWSLFSRRQLEPTEIVCIAPTVTLEYDAQKGRYTAEELIAAVRRHARSGRSGGLKGRLPIISIRDVRLRMLTGQTRLNVSMVPTGGTYRVTVEEQGDGRREPLRGIWRIDLATGAVRLEESNIPKIAHADGILPARYAKWRQRYDIRGKVVLKGRPATAPAEAVLEAQLSDVSLKLQPAEGGLQLTGVRGTLIFNEDGVSARDLTGRIPQAGGATFTMSGQYGGYDPNSPFDLHITAEGMVLPDGSRATGWLGNTLKFLNQTFQPTGKLDISADFKRLTKGRIKLKGSARPRGMSFVYEQIPYRLDQVTGSIGFAAEPSADRVYLTNVTGRRGDAEMTISGEIDLRNKGRYEVTVLAKRASLDAEMRAALPETYRSVWDTFSPSGTTDATIRVWKAKAGEPQNVDVLLSMTGDASVAYSGFPYRLEGLTGQVRMGRQEVTIGSLRGRRGSMHCTIDGSLLALGASAGRTDLTMEATDLPLDANLIAALPDWTRKAAEALHATGTIERVSATLRQSKGQPLDFRAVARVKNASFRAEAFPYEVREASGFVTVRPGRAIIEELSGRHGRTPISISGQVLSGRGAPGVDLQVKAKGVPLDKELFAAVPKEVQRIWRKLSASGRADVDLSLRHGMPDAEKEQDYRLVIRADGMSVRYEDFPYTLEGIVGEAVATPEGVKLKDMAAAHGRAGFVISGDLTFGEASEAASLSLRGKDVPIDQELLAAVPASLAPLAGRFRPGGTCDIDLKDFRVLRVLAPGPGAATRPTTAPASRPAAKGEVSWSMKGQVAFHGATIDVGLGHKRLSGSIDGAAAQRGSALALSAVIDLDSVEVARQRLTKLHGRLTKEPGGQLMRLDNLSAKAHGGQVAGFAEIRLADPLEFGVSLSVDAIQLADLFKADPAANGGRSEVQGLLAGNVQLTATAGERPRRQASGVLRISRGKLYKLPVMLGLLHVVYLSLPGETAFTEGNLAYHLNNDTLVFDEIYLRGTALSIVGSGTMDMKTEALNLTFLSGPPRKLPRLGSLGELLEGIAREVAEIRVAGTLQKPKMQTVPLRGLDRILRDLLNPGRGK
ncbi:MAG: AsmA-like C-terminal region-containing protein [Phycisphaerae bacterium]